MFYQTVKMRTPGLLNAALRSTTIVGGVVSHSTKREILRYLCLRHQRPVKIGLVTDCTKDCSDKTQFPLWKLKPLLQNISSENTGFA